MNILMVCLGNICRSPLAEGLVRSKIDALGLDWKVDSAGTSGYHIGQKPDRRSIEIGRRNNVDISQQRSRKFIKEDFNKFDLIITMDASNYNDVKKMASNQKEKEKIELMLNFLNPGQNETVPDPYYDGNFEKVYYLLDQASDALISKLNSTK